MSEHPTGPEADHAPGAPGPEQAENAPDAPQSADAAAPRTGEPVVDRAMDSLQGLESAPLADHHDRLARAHEDLHRALNTDQEQQTPDES